MERAEICKRKQGWKGRGKPQGNPPRKGSCWPTVALDCRRIPKLHKTKTKVSYQSKVLKTRTQNRSSHYQTVGGGGMEYKKSSSVIARRQQVVFQFAESKKTKQNKTKHEHILLDFWGKYQRKDN